MKKSDTPQIVIDRELAALQKRLRRGLHDPDRPEDAPEVPKEPYEVRIERLQEELATMRECLREMIRIADTLSGWELDELDYARQAKVLCGYDDEESA